MLGLADLKEYKGPARLFGVEENGEAVDELLRKLRTEFVPPLVGVQWLRLSCNLHNGPAKGQRGHLVVAKVQRSAQVHSLVSGGTYTRMDRGNRELSAEEITELSYRRGTRSAAAEPVPVALERLDTQAWHRFLRRRGPLTGDLAEQLLNIGLAVTIDGRVQPLRAAVLLFADEPGSLLAAHGTRADIRVFVYDGKAPVHGATPSLDAGEGVKMMFAEMARARLYPPQYRENADAAVESLTVLLLNHERPTAWDEVSDWLDRHGMVANADVVRITGTDTLRASKLLTAWREQGLLVALPGRAKRNMAYAKPQALAATAPVSLFTEVSDNNPDWR